VLALNRCCAKISLWFHAELPHLTNLYLQFSRFRKFKMRGIPFAISRLMYYRTQSRTISDMAVYGSELYSPAFRGIGRIWSWERD
jgi:hypothetical protein